jgi:hypothetical protein
LIVPPRRTVDRWATDRTIFGEARSDTQDRQDATRSGRTGTPS